MLIGYARASKADGSQSLDLQRNALLADDADSGQIYEDYASGAKDERTGLEACLRALRDGDVLVIWKLDRLSRNLAHLVGTVQDLSNRVGPRVLAGQGAQIDTTSAGGGLVFDIFAALAEFERGLIRERTVAELKAARASRDTSVAGLCWELGVGRVTLYRSADSGGSLRKHGRSVLDG